METILKSYDAKLDSKNRISIRGARFDYYSVTEYENGKIVLEPRVLVAPFEVSENTLSMMDKSMENLKKGKAGKPIELDEF